MKKYTHTQRERERQKGRGTEINALGLRILYIYTYFITTYRRGKELLRTSEENKHHHNS